MHKYKCPICNKTHDIFRVAESPEPELLRGIPENERENRIYDMGGLYIVDNEVLLGNGDILINMEDLDEPIFYWQVWVKISISDFQKNLEALKNGGSVKLQGELISELPFYPESKGLQVNVLVGMEQELNVIIEITQESQIKKDQFKPISKERVIELMGVFYHPELFTEKIEFEKSFSERLQERLAIANKKYVKKKKSFAINVNASSTTLFQIVNSQMLESAGEEKIGFGIHLAFDDTFEESKEQINTFKKQTFSNDFKYFNIEQIPSFQINFGLQLPLLEKYTTQLVQDVYQEDIESTSLELLEI